MDKLLSLDYFDDEQSRDFVKLLDCYDSPLYFILKSKYKEENPCEIFLRDITFRVIQNKDGSLYDINFFDGLIIRDLFSVRETKTRGAQGMRILEKLLRTGEGVIVQTFDMKIPFFIHYNPQIPFGDIRLGHCFLVIGQDQDNLIYVEDPKYINQKHFKPYNGRKSVGIIKKSELMDAFNCFLYCLTIEIKEANLFDTARINRLLSRIARNYYKSSENENGFIISYGREGILKLRDIFSRGGLLLNKPSDSYQLDLFSQFHWKFNLIINRRKMLLRYLLKYSGQYEEEPLHQLISRVESAVAIWENVINILAMRYVKQKYLIGSELEGYMFKILTIEDEINRSLVKFLERQRSLCFG